MVYTLASTKELELSLYNTGVPTAGGAELTAPWRAGVHTHAGGHAASCPGEAGETGTESRMLVELDWLHASLHQGFGNAPRTKAHERQRVRDDVRLVCTSLQHACLRGCCSDRWW